MIETLKEIFTSPAGSFGSVFAIFMLLFLLVYKAGKIVEKYKVVDKVQSNIDKIKDDISEIKAFIQVFRQNNNPFAQVKSPISLTKLGSNVSIDLHIERMVKKKWIELEKEISLKIKEDFNPYNIQEVCFEIGKNYSNITTEENFDYIKKYAFNKGYNLSDFDLIFGIMIRDEFFDKKRLNVSDIDNYAPNDISK